MVIWVLVFTLTLHTVAGDTVRGPMALEAYTSELACQTALGVSMSAEHTFPDLRCSKTYLEPPAEDDR